ncbi:MAG: M48 family metalloprotease [Candidatus Binataceae bacterium]
MMTTRRSKFFGAVLMLALATQLSACAPNPATGASSLTGFSSTANEAQTGEDQNPAVLASFGGAYADASLEAYVNDVGQRVAAGSERKDITYRFQVLDSPIVNALAIPGGYIYVSRGLLALVNNEAELAGVLGHEVGHVAAMHHAQGQVRDTIAQVGMLPLAIVSPLLLGAPQMAAQSYLRSFTRDAEYEADKLGIRYVARAGYDPAATATFLSTMRNYEQVQARIDGRSAGSVDQFDYMATHPNAIERYRRALAQAAELKVANPIVRRREFLAQADGIIYGESPEQGFIRGLAFEHPKLRFRFEAPPGFQMFDTAAALYAAGPDNAMIIFDGAPEASSLPMTGYIRQVWAKDNQVREVRRGEINGLEAGTAIASAATRRGPMTMRLVAIRMDDKHNYRFRFIAPTPRAQALAPAFAKAAASFKRLSAAEAAAIKPRKINVVAVTKNDTIAKLAARSAFDEFPQEQFRVLNGLASSSDSIPLQQVKLVVE